MTTTASNPAATELRRQCYLQAMGLDSYIARGPLPGGALCPRLLLKPKPAPAERPQVSAAPVRRESPAPMPVRTAPAQQASAPRKQVAAAPQVAADAFSIAAIVSGGVLWLEELSQPLLAREQVQLILAMAAALGLPGGQPQITQFDWPIHQNTQFDLGEEAARAGLSSFVLRRVEQSACRAVILLGEPCSKRLGPMAADVRRLQTVATAAMLENAALKSRAWQDLRPLSEAAG